MSEDKIIYQPVGKGILIELPELKDYKKSKTGIFVPEGKDKKSRDNKAIIVMIGDLVIKTILEIGDEILFHEANGELIKQGPRRFKIVELEDIYAVKNK